MKRTLLLALLWLAFFMPNMVQAKEMAEVLDDLISAAQENPTDSKARREAGMAYLYLARQMGDTPARIVFGTMADFHLDAAAQLDPGDDKALEHLAETAVLLMTPGKAATVYEILVSRQTDPAEGRFLVPLHTCYQWLRDPWRGIAFYREQLDRMPDWPQMKFLLATLLLDLDRSEAMDILEELYDAPSTPPALKATIRMAVQGGL
jgi:tetratricopeptide (TPR) repeat protein